jgi:Helitron helicase-like domain at N-terminus
LTLRKNPATLWVALNFADTSDPIVQILAGEEINMDHFIATAGPDHTCRAINAASDPFAAAKYFHISVKLVLEELYGISVNWFHHIDRQVGIFGQISAYVGTVEAQGTLET